MLRSREAAAASCCSHGGTVALVLDEKAANKNRGKVRRKREDMGKGKSTEMGAGNLWCRRKWRNAAAAIVAPATNSDGLAVR